ncbi:N-acetyl-D-glucosamine kinase [Hyalella azteca]|uniref:N-acetyl-D-glucosamine kinase n=1 Tax=Hyalella azteca TaxID=294128 RepID=A0A8B7N778_HYAAZ|nr:N-acetyl-D-glucosamine kinase [Hyalella azteca]
MNGASNHLFGGIEGGGTQSTIILMDSSGRSLVQYVGPSTNHYATGMEECARRLAELVDVALKEAGLPPNTSLKALGLCLSGCEDEATNAGLEQELRRQRPDLAELIVVASDTLGPIATACPRGGVVVISGTAYWIAARAVKLLIDEEDHLVDPPHPTHALRTLVLTHFNIEDRFGMLHHCYQNFSKSFYASLTRGIADLATKGDVVCQQLMFDGGEALGRHVAALSRNIDSSLYDPPDGLSIICVGSVWKSFELLRPGFVAGLRPRSKLDVSVPRWSLLRLKTSSALGAVYLAAKKADCDIPRDYDKNAEVIFRYSDAKCPDKAVSS